MTQSAHGKLFDNQPLSVSDRYSPWIRITHQNVNVHAKWAAGGGVTGAWKVELSNDPTCEVEINRNQNLGASSAADKIDFTAEIDPVYGNGFTVTGAGNFMFALTGGVARYFRIWFDRTSGDANSLCSAWYNQT